MEEGEEGGDERGVGGGELGGDGEEGEFEHSVVFVLRVLFSICFRV